MLYFCLYFLDVEEPDTPYRKFKTPGKDSGNSYTLLPQATPVDSPLLKTPGTKKVVAKQRGKSCQMIYEVYKVIYIPYWNNPFLNIKQTLEIG